MNLALTLMVVVFTVMVVDLVISFVDMCLVDFMIAVMFVYFELVDAGVKVDA